MKPNRWWFAAAQRIRKVCVAGVFAAFAVNIGAAQAASEWKEPASSLAAQIASLLGPGPVVLSIRNLSSIPADQIPAIRKILEENLKAHGVTAGGQESASSVRVTLTENARERLWVAEVVEGNETKVAMIELGPVAPEIAKSASVLSLRSRQMVTAQEPVLAALEMHSGLLALEPDQVVLYAWSGSAWQERQRMRLGIVRPHGRDQRGALLGAAGGTNFDAWLPGVHCTGSVAPPPDANGLKVDCHESDDPWAVTQPPLGLVDAGPSPSGANVNITSIRAFYNGARNSFTGVLVPGAGLDLPTFFALAMVPRTAGAAVLIEGVDGRVQMIENGALHAIAGTRDWGSDLAILQSGCGSGAQVVVSGSGDAAGDNLRAYELTSYVAAPVSEALEVNGSVMALDAAGDGKSVLAIVHRAGNLYEVDRVTALCN